LPGPGTGWRKAFEPPGLLDGHLCSSPATTVASPPPLRCKRTVEDAPGASGQRPDHRAGSVLYVYEGEHCLTASHHGEAATAHLLSEGTVDGECRPRAIELSVTQHGAATAQRRPLKAGGAPRRSPRTGGEGSPTAGPPPSSAPRRPAHTDKAGSHPRLSPRPFPVSSTGVETIARLGSSAITYF